LTRGGDGSAGGKKQKKPRIKPTTDKKIRVKALNMCGAVPAGGRDRPKGWLRNGGGNQKSRGGPQERGKEKIIERPKTVAINQASTKANADASANGNEECRKLWLATVQETKKNRKGSKELLRTRLQHAKELKRPNGKWAQKSAPRSRSGKTPSNRQGGY